MMHSDVRNRLRDAIQAAHAGTGSWAHYVDHNGDGESGDCIYSVDDKTKSAPYEIQTQGDKTVANIDTANAETVTPRVTYDSMADDDDNYASMMEAALYTKGEMPLCERFISKDERDKADGDSFAGKGKSFPILKPGDVMAAVRSMGRAGSGNYGVAQLKANIIRIAKAKGWESELPKTWRGGTDAKESLKIRESYDWTPELALLESSGSEMEVKLIAPGQGSSAFYPAEVLKRDGPGVFKKNTQIYINHATAAEEAARPEGDWHKLVGALSTDAVYHESHPKGPGLYAKANFAPDMAPIIKAKAPYSGMSIRASGVAESGKSKGGVPILKSLTSAESVDIVTKAGAGGMILTESARAANQQEVDMTEAEVTRLIESRTAPLRERAIRGDAIVLANQTLAPLTGLTENLKQFAIDNVLQRGALPIKENELDAEKFKALIEAEAKRVAAAFGFRGVQGMGAGEPVVIDPKVREAQIQAAKDEEEEAVRIFESLGMPKEAATLAAKGRAA